MQALANAFDQCHHVARKPSMALTGAMMQGQRRACNLKLCALTAQTNAMHATQKLLCIEQHTWH
jgi:hypothetical protein